MWAEIKGEWRVKDGASVVKELRSDKHAAVLICKLKNRDSIVRFSFRVDDATKGFNFSLNQAKGYLFRITVAPKSLTACTDELPKDISIKSERLGQSKGKFEQGKWYTLQVEMVVDRTTTIIDHTALWATWPPGEFAEASQVIPDR